MTKILRIDSSARYEGSVTRELADKIIAQLGATETTIRDLAKGLPLLSEDWIGANFTPVDDRSASQKETLGLSDSLIAEIDAADVLVIGLPIYNFGSPASLKAWMDLVARAGVTFRYTENGPEGLMKGKRAIIAIASGGVETGSAVDYASTHLRQFLGFIGITEVDIVRADLMMVDAEASNARTKADLAALAA